MNHEEFKIHRAIVEHHKGAFPHIKLMYVPNRVADATEAYFNKILGAQPGAHDLFIMWGKPFKMGIFEVKSKSGKLSTAQNKFASALHSMGAYTGYGSSVKAYHDCLKRWGIEARHDGIKEPDLRTDEQKKADAFNLYRRPE